MPHGWRISERDGVSLKKTNSQRFKNEILAR